MTVATQIVQVNFDEEAGIQIQWFDPDEHDKQGGTYHTSMVTRLAQEEVAEVNYYAKELRQDVDELLAHWLKTRR